MNNSHIIIPHKESAAETQAKIQHQACNMGIAAICVALVLIAVISKCVPKT